MHDLRVKFMRVTQSEIRAPNAVGQSINLRADTVKQSMKFVRSAR